MKTTSSPTMKNPIHRKSLLRLFCGVVLATASMGPALAQPYTIPVVVHVLYTNSPGTNISDAQILDGLNLLNERFNGEYPGTISPPFDTLVADMGITFCLASLAPDGSATTGIVRTLTPWALHGGQPEAYMDPWPRDRYLNIWVVATMDGDSSMQRAYRPEQVDTDPSRDGIMLENGSMGTIGTGSYHAATRLVGYAGRYLGLKLLWEDPIGAGPCGDDDVADTPPCEIFFGCDPSGQASCEAGVPANVENYMSYSYCYMMFTHGQKARVIDALNSPVAQRNNLWTSTNLALTGCATSGIGEPDRPVKLLASPNPFRDRITLSGLPHGTVLVELLDLSGRTVHSWNLRGGADSTHAFVVGVLPSGTYLIRASGPGGTAFSLVQGE